MLDLIREFLAQKTFAVIGATENIEKYGYKIFKTLRNQGYEVDPVNPRLKKIEGTKCYPILADIPLKVGVVDFAVPPRITESILKERKQLGLNRIWLQHRSESEVAIAFCHQNDMKVVHDVCVMIEGG